MASDMSSRILCAVALTCLLPLGCGGGNDSGLGPPNVLIYLVDTTRADHLSAYGYARATTPRLEHFARESVLFERAYSPSSWTRASTASLLTGLDPARHGARSRKHRISKEAPLLAEVLAAEGYLCAAIVTNPHVVETWGFGRGFELFEDLGALAPRWQDADASLVTERVEPLLDGFADDPRPFFLYVHTIDPHGPNTPPEPYDRLFTDNPRVAPLPGALTLETPAEDVENMRALYDAELRYADEYFGRLLDALRARNLYDNTLIVFTSDHGEEHLEHGRGGHGQQLFEECVRVPLVVHFPGAEGGGKRITARASLLDMVPTILAVVGADAPPGLDGVDLSPLLSGAGGVQWEQRPFFLDLDLLRHDGKLHRAEGVIRGHWKYVLVHEPEPKALLFNLASDPEERKNRNAAEPEIARTMRGLLHEKRAEDAAGVHLLLASDRRSPEPTTVRARLHVEGGRLRDLVGIELEDEDVYSVDPITEVIELAFVLRETSRHSTIRQRKQQDLDGLIVRLEPPTARLVIDSIEGMVGILFARGEKLAGQTWPLTLAADATDWPAPPPDQQSGRRAAGTYLWVHAAPELIEIPKDLGQRMRELGYAGDD